MSMVGELDDARGCRRAHILFRCMIRRLLFIAKEGEYSDQTQQHGLVANQRLLLC